MLVAVINTQFHFLVKGLRQTADGGELHSKELRHFNQPAIKFRQ